MLYHQGTVEAISEFIASELKGKLSMLREVSKQPTPEHITSLQPNQVFVFGSNTEGRHGAGAAKSAMQWGAEYGNPSGHQGQTYAIVTKDLSKGERSIPLTEIESQIETFLSHAQSNPQSEFLVTKIGCALAGYSEQEIGGLWADKEIPENVRLPQSFIDVVQKIGRPQEGGGVNKRERIRGKKDGKYWELSFRGCCSFRAAHRP